MDDFSNLSVCSVIRTGSAIYVITNRDGRTSPIRYYTGHRISPVHFDPYSNNSWSIPLVNILETYAVLDSKLMKLMGIIDK